MEQHHGVLLKQMKRIEKLKQKVRHQKNAHLPHNRPIWLPHYFWHWLHHFPHFHQLHHGVKEPGISSAAYLVDSNQYTTSSAQSAIDNAMYIGYDDDSYYYNDADYVVDDYNNNGYNDYE